MIESLGTLIYELAVESLIASAVLWAAVILLVRLDRVKDAAWQSRFFLLPVGLPVPLVLLIHLLIRPYLPWPADTPLEKVLVTMASTSSWIPPVALGLMTLALLIGSAQVLRLLVNMYRQRMEWCRQQQEQSPLWLRCNSILHTVAQKLQIPTARVVLVKGKNSGSLALGPLGSYILVSSDLALLLNEVELGVLLAHELGHIKRQDTLADALMGLPRQLLSFSPFVHWAHRRYTWARELAVDDIAVRESDPLALASCLIKACRVSQGNVSSVPGNSFFSSTSTVERRIRRLIAFPAGTPNRQRCHRLAYFGVIVVAMTLFLLVL